MKLDLCNYKEKQAYFKNKYLFNYKIVINSPEMCFGIKRQFADVDCKNLIIFSYKNSFMRILQNWKTIFIK
jgi:hypothetical protein